MHCLIFWTVLLPDEATCLMFDCVRKVVGNLANMAITITLQRALNTSIRGEKKRSTSINVQACYNKLANIANEMIAAKPVEMCLL